MTPIPLLIQRLWKHKIWPVCSCQTERRLHWWMLPTSWLVLWFMVCFMVQCPHLRFWDVWYDRYVLEIWYLDAIAVACCCWQRSLRYIAIIAQERGKGHGRRLVQHGPPPKSHKKRQFLRVNLYALRHFVYLNLYQLLDPMCRVSLYFIFPSCFV